MKKLIICLAITLILIAMVIGIFYFKNQNSNDTDMKTIAVSEVTRSIFYAPQYVALSQGFFEEEGLKIELTTAQGADAVMTSVLANQSDIGFAGPEASIYVYNEGKEDYTEVFAQLTKRDRFFFGK